MPEVQKLQHTPRRGRHSATTPAEAPDPLLSVIVLTLDEADNLDHAVTSLLDQDVPLEVLIVDGKSTDGTVEIARELEANHVDRVRLVASDDLPVGPARNLGLANVRAPYVAFMSADATAAPGWARAMVEALVHNDIVYGRQEHTPPRLNVPAVVRGLRYHHFSSDETAPPATYASNVNAAIRREVFHRLHYVNEGPASALDDILFTEEAQQMGLTVGYQASAVVRHKDATTLRGELVKNRREGYGWGILAPQLGTHRALLAWGGALAAAGALAAVRPDRWTLLLLAGMTWAPALRRAAKAGRPFARRAPVALAGAVAVSPMFDLAFLFDYLRGLRRRRPELTGRVTPQGARS